jgi:HlyD family secretion protein
MRARWWIVSALALALVVGGLALRRKPAPATSKPQTAASLPETASQITLQGKIRPQHILGVAAGVQGLIEAFMVEPGEEVFQGQVLARIGAQTLESSRESAANALEHAQDQVNRAEAVLAAARLELSRAEADAARSRLSLDRVEKAYSRQQTLYREGATPRLTFEKVQAEYESARKDYDIMWAAVQTGREHVQSTQKDVDNARKTVNDKRSLLEEAQQNLAGSEVRSPVDGYVIAHEGEIGSSAEELGEKFFTIATDLYALEVLLDVKPEVLKRIIPGMPVTVAVLDLDSAAFEGTVKEISDKDKQVVVEFASNNPAVKPGQTADVRFRFQ